MKKRLLIATLVLIIFVSGLSAVVNGRLSQIGDKYLLQVWGTHYERGYATGYLLAQNIMNVFTLYFYTNVTGSSANTYNYYLQYHQSNFSTDARYPSEAQGMFDGMSASGVSMYHSGLQRNLTINDILFVNSIVDIAGLMQGKDPELGCSSLSSWGQATMADPMLQGKLVITRLMDWNRNNTLIANPLLVVHHPSEPDERKWMSFTYPGLFGALSGITENQAAAFLNMGNIHTHTQETNLSNVLFDIRSGLERVDYNADGVHNTEDVFAAISNGLHIGGTIIHNVQQWADSSRAAIIETNNSGTVRRMHNQNSNIAGDNLATTNHFRLLYNPVPCSRYSRIIDSLNVSPIVTSERQLTIMKGAGGISNNLMLIQYEPVSGQILWAVASGTLPAYAAIPVELDAAELFVQPTGVNDDLLPELETQFSLYPNPLTSHDVINVSAPKNLSTICIYNLRGQLLYKDKCYSNSYSIPVETALSKASSGVYFSTIEFSNGTRRTAKFLYIR